MPGRAGSSPDNDGTYWYCQTVGVRQARREGARREISGVKPRKSSTGSNLADMGRGVARDLAGVRGSTLELVGFAGEETTVKDCGVAVVMLPGQELGA